MSLGLTGFSPALARTPLRWRPPQGTGTWLAAFAVALALHLAILGYALKATPEDVDGGSEDAITVDLLPDPSDQADKPDDVAGPQATDSMAPTSQKADADDPDPPAPDAPPPTVVERKPDVAAPEVTAPAAPVPAEAELPPPVEAKPQEKPPETTPVEKPPEDAQKAEEERKTAPSAASSGSAALLGGGRRPSPAALATWRGSIGRHLGKLRRYPAEARARAQQGTAKVRVSIDGEGHVLKRDLAASSGKPLLDEEALELAQRADPFPKPPPGMPVPVVLTVPVVFSIRGG